VKAGERLASISRKKVTENEIGAAFYNPKTQSITLYLDALPVKGKLVLFKPRR